MSLSRQRIQQFLPGGTSGGGGSGPTGTLVTGPQYGGRTDGATVETECSLAMGQQTFNLAAAGLAASGVLAMGQQTFNMAAAGLTGSAGRGAVVNKVGITAGGNAAAIENPVGTNWTNINNATGIHDGTNATFAGSATQARSGVLVLTYANAGWLKTNGYHIRSFVVNFYAQSAGTSLNNGNLQFRWRFNGGGWNTLATYTDNQNFLTTPDSYDLTELIHDLDDFDNFEVGVFAATDLGEVLITYACDAVEIVVSLHGVEEPVIVPSAYGTGTSVEWHIDAMRSNAMFKDSGKTLSAAKDNESIIRMVDHENGLDFTGFSDTHLELDDRGPLSRINLSLGSIARLQRDFSPAITSELTFFIAFERTGTVTDAVFLSDLTIDSTGEFYVAPTEVGFHNGTTTQTISLTDKGSNSLMVVAVRIDTNGVEAWLDGISQGADTGITQGVLDFVLYGITGNSSHYLLESFCYSEALSDANIVEISALLQRKWDIF